MGADVQWRTRNWGEPPLNIPDYKQAAELAPDCKDETCYQDEVLLAGLKRRIQSSDKSKILIVLHTKGSHGPSYYTRYPSSFEKFTPVCKQEEISKCSYQELVNAYDNSILYTDYFLNKAITQLETLQDTPVLFIYISDHGESLGENGLYLHGAPIIFAPDVQKRIPFIIWTSDAFTSATGKSVNDIPTMQEYSQLHVFHTVIGALGLQTKAYNPNLDLFSDSHRPDTQNIPRPPPETNQP